MKKKAFLLIYSIMLALYMQVNSQTVFPIKIDFEGLSDELVCDRSVLENELGLDINFVNGFNQNRAFIDNEYSFSGTNSLRVLYPSGGVGPKQTGAQAPIAFAPQNEMYMTYSMKLSENFTYGSTNFGGKLPGLAGGGLCSGGSTCNGSNGFTARFMFQRDGNLILYLYHMDKPGTYGQVFKVYNEDKSRFQFEKGRWYTITQRVKINTGNNKNGEVQCWLDGREVINIKGIRFVNNGDKIDNLFFSTFHGGATLSYSPVEDCYIWFDNMIISNNAQDVFKTQCIKPNLGNDQSLCGYESLTLNSGINNIEDDFVFTWYKDGEIIQGATGPTYTTTQTGEYKVVLVSEDCETEDVIRVIGAIPVPDLGADKYFTTGSSAKLYGGVSGNYNYKWYIDGFEIAGANNATYNANKCGDYSLKISALSCTEVEDEVTVFEVNPIAATASGNDGNLPENVLDENSSTRWSSLGDGEWLELDLGSVTEVNGIALAFYKGNVRKASFSIQTSEDGQNYETQFDKISSAGNTLEYESFAFSTPVSARYIKYVGFGTNENKWNSITKFYIDYTSSVCSNDDPANANLSSIESSVGVIFPNFKNSLNAYVITLPYGTAPPKISGIPESATATVEVEQATAVPGVAKIHVVSENKEVTKDFTVKIIESNPIFLDILQKFDSIAANDRLYIDYQVGNGQVQIGDFEISIEVIDGPGSGVVYGKDVFFIPEGNSSSSFFNESKLLLTVKNSQGIVAEDTAHITIYNSNTIPGVVEMENYRLGGSGFAYYDTDPDNVYADFRPQGEVDMKEYDGGITISYLYPEEWIEYSVFVEAGTYEINVRSATPYDDCKVVVYFDDELFDTITFPNTGNFAAFTTFEHNRRLISLTSGEKTMRLDFLSMGMNINWIEFVKYDDNIATKKLQVGCNLVGFDALPVENNVVKVFSALDYHSVKDFDGFISQQPDYLNSLNSLTYGAGYLVCLEYPGILQYISTNPPIALPNTNLEAGWNLITALSEKKISDLSETITIVKDMDSFYEKDNGGTLETVVKGDAYFIFSNTESEIVW